MKPVFEVHWGEFYVLPCLRVWQGECECCGGDGNYVASFSWGTLSLHIVFGGHE